MTTKNKNLARALLAATLLAGAAGAANAGGRVNWSISIGLPLAVGVVGNGPVAYGPPPVVVAPPPVVYAPPRVVYAPPQVVYAPAPVVYAPPVYGRPRVIRPVPIVVPYRGGWKQHHGRWHDDD